MGDIWKVIEAVEENFEKRVGLTELMYGQTAVPPPVPPPVPQPGMPPGMPPGPPPR